MIRDRYRNRGFPRWPVALACLGLAAALAVPGTSPARGGAVAEVHVGKEAIQWKPLIEFERLSLAVSGPGVEIRREFNDKQRVYLAVEDREWGRLPAGTYRYELRSTPRLSPEWRRKLAEIREAEQQGRPVDREKLELPPRAPSQSGKFTIRDRWLVSLDEREPGRETKQTGDMEVQGDLRVRGAKSFVAAAPGGAGGELVYAALEGPEAGTYHRGSARTVGGEAVIDLPEHFATVTEAEGLTVQLTPSGAWSRLFVVEKTPGRLVVRSAGAEQAGEVEFDYLIQGVRRGYADFEVERRAPAGDRDSRGGLR